MRRVVLALGCLAFAAGAHAHTKSETDTVWTVSGSTVHMTDDLPLVEANRLAPPGSGPPSDAAVSAYLGDHVSVTSRGRPCPRSGTVRALAATEQFRRFEATFQCPTSEGIVLHSSAFFEKVPSHITLAQIQTDSGDFVEQIFTRDHQSVDASASAGSPLQSAGFLTYVAMGVMHIFTGVDHMCFLLGLVLLSRRLRDLAFVVTGFTLGHSVTLALAVTGVVRPHPEFIDALVALTIAVVAAENVALASGRPRIVAGGLFGLLLLMALGHVAGWIVLPASLLLGAALFCSCYLLMSGHLHDAARLRLIVTLVFGLIHGFGFAAGLLEMKLPSNRLAELLVGFNLGVEIGQLTVVTGILLLVAVLVRLRLALPRPIVVDTASAGLVGIGLYWFFSRSLV